MFTSMNLNAHNTVLPYLELIFRSQRSLSPRRDAASPLSLCKNFTLPAFLHICDLREMKWQKTIRVPIFRSEQIPLLLPQTLNVNGRPGRGHIREAQSRPPSELTGAVCERGSARRGISYSVDHVKRRYI